MKVPNCILLLIVSLIKTLLAAPYYPFNSNFHQSNAQASANAFNNFFNSNGFGSSASNAFTQSFDSPSPINFFGSSASSSHNQEFQVSKFGQFLGNANIAASQVYNFGNRKINVAYSNGFSIGPDGIPKASNSHAITFDRKK